MTRIEVDKDNPNYCSIDGALFTKDQEILIICPQGKKDYSIPRDVIRIGDRAFWHCSKLSSLVIPDSVEKIGIQTFGNCPDLILQVLKDSYVEEYAQIHGIKYETYE